ncbi:MAG: hypothetical protein NC218_05920 [Acetobacter sp.]|nr:hypothetical protein [Acetobacter sp.]
MKKNFLAAATRAALVLIAIALTLVSTSCSSQTAFYDEPDTPVGPTPDPTPVYTIKGDTLMIIDTKSVNVVITDLILEKRMSGELVESISLLSEPFVLEAMYLDNILENKYIINTPQPKDNVFRYGEEVEKIENLNPIYQDGFEVYEKRKTLRYHVSAIADSGVENPLDPTATIFLRSVRYVHEGTGATFNLEFDGNIEFTGEKVEGSPSRVADELDGKPYVGSVSYTYNHKLNGQTYAQGQVVTHCYYGE